VFTCFIKQASTPSRWLFEISDRCNDHDQMIQFIRYLVSSEARMVGFNNLGFDWPVVDFILSTPAVTPAAIYQKVVSIIHASGDDSDDRWRHIIWNPIVPQIDLYKIHHFDNQARRTSLKALEFNMRSASIEDLPYAPGTVLTSNQIDRLITYNAHDVECTEEFYHKSVDAIQFREQLSAKYNRNFLNHNDTKIGKDYMIMELERLVPGSCYLPGTRTPRQTYRAQIALADVIFPYIQFTRPEFTAVRDWFAAQVISETKKIFSDILSDRLGQLAQYATLKPVKGGGSKAVTLNTVVNGFQFDFGTGGIHGSVSSRTVRSSDTHCILDVDVTSLYPSIGIVNRLYPEHLGETFYSVYSGVKDQRVSYAKGTPENAMLKLALNGVYGDSNNQYSPFYDPQYTMAITINGQLLLCMLADSLMYIPGLEIIQINTDGITVYLPRGMQWVFDHFCRCWEGVTALNLEQVEYQAMYIRDVNNYIAVTLEGKVKSKGAYEHKDLGWHKDHSALVIPKAAEAALLHGTPVDQFVRSHGDMLDFMCRAKVPRNSRLMLGERQIQNVSRYYVSHTGASLVKIMPPLAKVPDKERSIGIAVGWLVTECNRLPTSMPGDINYEYYISEAEKLVNPLVAR
jgi:hypothetical protein